MTATQLSFLTHLTGDQLNAELTGWLEAVNPLDESFPIKGTKAIIAPSVSVVYNPNVG